MQQRPNRPRYMVLPAALLLLGLQTEAARAMDAAVAAAEPAAPVVQASDAPQPYAAAALPEGAYTYEVPLSAYGARYALRLLGVNSSYAVPFGVRADEEVLGATLKMDYAYSPSLIPELSHLKVLLNDEVTVTLPLPKEQAGSPRQDDVALPVQLLKDYNQLNMELIAHYTMECEDPLHSSLWANVSNQSTLALTVAPRELPNDLSILPRPFFDPRDARRLQLPFVFAAAPDNAGLEAAGTLSSWLGALAGYRGAKFSVEIGALPARGSAIVLLQGQASIAGLQLEAATGPTLQLVTNPNDRFGKLLLVRGNNSAELKTAAAALALGTQALSGATATIASNTDLAPRKPYDAPNWLRSDRAVSFGELASARNLNVSGYRPDTVSLDLRLPPDLFAWRDREIPIDLRYRYTPRPTADQSTLNVQVNDQFLRSLPLVPEYQGAYRHTRQPLSEAHDRIMVPVGLLGAQGSLDFLYFFDYVKQGECRDVIIDNVRGAIDPDSTIDISGFSHYLAMPDLAAYSRAGFPFTRMADLSETAVILPQRPAAEDYAAYLTLMGRMGESTGYPALRVTVADAAQAGELRDKDLLVLDAGNRQPLVKEWQAHMPGAIDAEQRRFEISDLVYRAVSWLDPDPQARNVATRGELALRTRGADTLITGFESPLASGRSVVLISSTRADGLAAAADALLDDRQRANRIDGSLVMVRDGEVANLAAERTYYVGKLGYFEATYWFFSRHPLLLILVALASVLLLAVVVHYALRTRAKRRLQS